MSSPPSRRQFIATCCAGSCGAALQRIACPSSQLVAFAAAPPTSAALGANSVWVNIFFAGGISHTAWPIDLGEFHDLYPTIYPANPLLLSSAQYIHPQLTSMKAEWDLGKLALIQGVGYPNPNQSHDESTEIILSAVRNMNPALTGGIGARLTCNLGNPFAGVSLAGANTFAQGSCNDLKAVADIDNFGQAQFWKDGTAGNLFQSDTFQGFISDGGAPPTTSALYVKGSMDKYSQLVTTLASATQGITIPVTFPNTGFGQACKDVFTLIQASPVLNLRVIFLTLGGFDTHSNEVASLNNQLGNFNGGMTALIAALKQVGRYDDVLFNMSSEFGRTGENGSGGTDHAHTTTSMVWGGKVQGGIKGALPTPQQLIAAKNSYLKHVNVDYRNIYRELITAVKPDADLAMIFPEAYSQTSLGLVA